MCVCRRQWHCQWQPERIGRSHAKTSLVPSRRIRARPCIRSEIVAQPDSINQCHQCGSRQSAMRVAGLRLSSSLKQAACCVNALLAVSTGSTSPSTSET